MGTRFLQPGKPWQNGFAESVHAWRQVECLNPDVVSSAKHAQVVLDGYRAFYTTSRPFLP
ncbi:transposase (plasmid) [Deinococcus taeanensis]|uniref:transposase n=1 Tax=Deinococcus taeanensis TaxID=2737050 RepID=UPI001CDC712D|nr:transposase [Deinococcus taeanensis]